MAIKKLHPKVKAFIKNIVLVQLTQDNLNIEKHEKIFLEELIMKVQNKILVLAGDTEVTNQDILGDLTFKAIEQIKVELNNKFEVIKVNLQSVPYDLIK
jgi:hypothetical protein